MIRFLLAALCLMATPAAAQLVTHPTKIRDTNNDGRLVLDATAPKVTPKVRKGTEVFPCGQQSDGKWLYALVTPSNCPEPPKPAGPLFGANLSGAEFEGSDALRPTLDDAKLYVEQYGFRLLRIPGKRDRITPERIVELQAIAEYTRSKGVPLILDTDHDYWWRPVEDFVSWWSEFARHFPDDGSVMLELTNEPIKGFNDPVLTNDWQQWARDSKLVIAGLRANGIKHPILLEWPQWSASFRFDKKEGAASPCVSAACALDRDKNGPLDPINRTYMSAHRYFDSNASGTTTDTSTLPTRKYYCKDTVSGLNSFATALRNRGLRAYLTESAFGSYGYGIHLSCVKVGAEAIAALKANRDVLLGVTWWGGGRAWSDRYHFKMEAPKTLRANTTSVYMKRLTGE